MDYNQLRNNYLQDRVSNSIDTLLDNVLDTTFNLKSRIQQDFGIILEDNQEEIVSTVIDLDIKLMNLLAARGGGKTFSIIIGTTVVCMDATHPISIGITAPKEEQAKRIIDTFYRQVLVNNSYLNNYLDKRACVATRIKFKNGCIWESFSGSELANEAGRHYDILIVDESQDVSDLAMSQVLLPMIGNSRIGKVIKLGTANRRGHFYKGFKNSNYVSLIYDWTQCGSLLTGGYVEYEGKIYSRRVLDRMPYTKKLEYFPNKPELWFDGDMTVEDFETQYENKWQLDSDNLLDEQDQLLLMDNEWVPTHGTKQYYFGLDLAGGSDVSIDPKHDFTQLTIVEVDKGVKRIVAGFEWQGDTYNQVQEIIDIVHPETGKYRCIDGILDRGSLGTAIYDQLRRKIPVKAIMYKETDPDTKKNYKNAMFDHFLVELRSNRVKYPKAEYTNKDKVLKKHINEWTSIVRKNMVGINAKIEAPTGLHDDCANSTVMAVYCADNKYVGRDKGMRKNCINKSGIGGRLPNLQKGVSPYA